MMKSPQGGGALGAFAPLGFTYHHLIALIKAAIAPIASIINNAISMLVGLFF